MRARRRLLLTVLYAGLVPIVGLKPSLVHNASCTADMVNMVEELTALTVSEAPRLSLLFGETNECSPFSVNSSTVYVTQSEV